jgi:hypothetical protein
LWKKNPWRRFTVVQLNNFAEISTIVAAVSGAAHNALIALDLLISNLVVVDLGAICRGEITR